MGQTRTHGLRCRTETSAYFPITLCSPCSLPLFHDPFPCDSCPPFLALTPLLMQVLLIQLLRLRALLVPSDPFTFSLSTFPHVMLRVHSATFSLSTYNATCALRVSSPRHATRVCSQPTHLIQHAPHAMPPRLRLHTAIMTPHTSSTAVDADCFAPRQH